MKLTTDGKTLFQALCDMFTNKVGAAINKRQFGDHSSLIAVRNKEGKIEKIYLTFRKTNIMTMNYDDNFVLPDVTQWFSQMAINRLNKALAFVSLKIRKSGESWVVEDGQGQLTPYKNAEPINLSRPHGSALYQVEDKV